NPHSWTLQTDLGVMLERRGQFAQAMVCHRQALRDNPGFVPAHNHLGCALSTTGNWQEAEAEFFTALRLSPSNPSVLGNLADHYFRQGKIREALAADGDALKADCNNPQRYTEFGLKLAANNQLEQA